MIGTTLSTLARLLDTYLKKEFQLQQELVQVKPLRDISPGQAGSEVWVSLVNIERETGAGISFNRKNLSGSYSQRGAPAWQINLFVLFTAVYGEKQYEEGLQIISAVILFLQKTPLFTLLQSDITLAIEPLNLSVHELANLWGICGGQYYPSVLCKVRLLTMDAGEMKQLHRHISQTNQEYE